MVLESEYIGGGGGREGTNRKEGGNLLDWREGQEGGGGGGWELCSACASAGSRAQQPGASSPTARPRCHLLRRNPRSGGSRLAGCAWGPGFLQMETVKMLFVL